jgi:hypothetical protein
MAYRRKISGSFKWEDLILPAVIIGAGYFLITKLGGAFTTNISAANDQAAANTTSTVANDLLLAKSSGIAQTLPDSVLSTLANTLYQQLGTSLSPDDPGAVIMSIEQLQTTTDWLRLSQLFGTKSFNTQGAFSLCSWTGMSCTSLDLGSAIKLAMGDNIAAVNAYFANTGINVQL